MTIESDIQKPDPGQLVEMFVLDATALGGVVSRWIADKNPVGASVVWDGDTYTAVPLAASDFAFSGRGTRPQPKIKVANVTGLVGALVREYDDLIGAKLTRKRTFLKYMDAVNFAGGVNPTADPAIAFPDDIYFIERKATETRIYVEFDLAAAFDVQGVLLPRRQTIQNVCPWRYRSAECSYAGGAVAAADDTATADLALDVCGKRLSSCRLRFGAFAQLPYGGFPAAGLIR